MTTTPLLPPYPPPLYYCIEALVEDIWNESVDLEEKYYVHPSEDITAMFAFNVMKIQYWESVSLQMQAEGRK
tara:strand:+ start:200 stop:415 length:216 start_codon:yes stop_codon:yes gene_type:complete